MLVLIVQLKQRAAIRKKALVIFIVLGFRIIVFIFIVICTTFRPICPLAFFRCLFFLFFFGGGLSPLSLLLFKLIEVSISSGCSSGQWYYSFFFFSFFVWGSDDGWRWFCWCWWFGCYCCCCFCCFRFCSCCCRCFSCCLYYYCYCCCCYLVFERVFSFLYRLPGSTILLDGIVPRLQSWLAWWGCRGCFCCCCCCCCGFGGLLKAGSWKIAYLLAGSTEEPPNAGSPPECSPAEAGGLTATSLSLLDCAHTERVSRYLSYASPSVQVWHQAVF